MLTAASLWLPPCTLHHLESTVPQALPTGYSRLQRLGHGADLVHFEQEAVAGLLTDGLGDPLRVGHREIVPNHLDACTSGELPPGFPVILVKGVLDGHH